MEIILKALSPCVLFGKRVPQDEEIKVKHHGYVSTYLKTGKTETDKNYLFWHGERWRVSETKESFIFDFFSRGYLSAFHEVDKKDLSVMVIFEEEDFEDDDEDIENKRYNERDLETMKEIIVMKKVFKTQEEV